MDYEKMITRRLCFRLRATIGYFPLATSFSVGTEIFLEAFNCCDRVNRIVF